MIPTLNKQIPNNNRKLEMINRKIAIAAFGWMMSGSVVMADYPAQAAAVDSVKIEGGFWGPRIDTNAKVTLPNNLQFIERTGRIATFDRAAGVNKQGGDNDVSVVDSDVYKILEGAAYTLQLRPDDVDADDIARQVARVIAAREDDGFLCPRITLKGEEFRWNNLHKSHVLYSAGHLFEAGAAWQSATGEKKLLAASAKFADIIDNKFGPEGVYETPGHQEIELALVRLYRATGEEKYLNLCRFFLEQRGHLHGGQERVSGVKSRAADYNQDRVPLAEAEHAVGHVVRAGYTYAAMADIVAIQGHEGFRGALDRLWDDVVGSKLYITGSSAAAQYYDEGFGDSYHLPNDTAYCETCSTISNAMWSHRMALLNEDASYIDVMERALYNGVLSGISLSGDHYFYTNPLASRGGVKRSPSWDPACCQSNLVRTIPQIGTMAYATGPETAFVNLFVAGEAKLKLQKGTVRLRVETEYPWDGKVRITVEKSIEEPFTIAVRIPGWATEKPVPSTLYRFAKPTKEAPSLKVAGESLETVATEKGYARLTRTWKTGDVIELNLPMPVRRVLSDERVEANTGLVALQRGPIVYCIEATDNGDQRTNAIVLGDDVPLRAERREDLLGGIVGVTADAAIASESAWGEPVEVRSQKLLAVPYFAWANRKVGYMDIWIAREPTNSTPLPRMTAIHDAKITDSTKSKSSFEALRDGRDGPKSESRTTPRVTLKENGEGKTWIQCEWSKPRELDRTSVYWAVDSRSQVYWGKRIRGTDLVLPRSWKVMYQDGDEWREVETDDKYTLRTDLPNEVRFSPIKTRALRLEIDSAPSPSAIQEWSID
jgi:DUF1680 family protein